MARTPRITVSERSLEAPLDVLSDPRYKKRLDNPFGSPSIPIQLKDPNRECRIFNAAIGSDHIWRAKQKGWDRVRPEDCAIPDQIEAFQISADGFLVRGERGQEHLMSMPKIVRKAIQDAKTRVNIANMGNPHAVKNEVVNAAGKQLGDEAASYLDKHVGPIGGVTDTYERVERVEPE